MRGKELGFVEFGREEPGYRPLAERVRDYAAVERRFTVEQLNRQAARCMDCGIPFCHAYGCPVQNLIPEFNDRVYHGKWREALELLQAGTCFPEFTGRICPAPCETACVLGINDDPVTIRLIELEIIERAFRDGYMAPRPPVRRRREKVAVVGSGPSGLAAAQMLNQAGFTVVVYENAARAGGILRYGIPDFKLEKWVVDRRIELMREEGVVFETGVEAGKDISLRFLRSRSDVILLTGGAMEPRDLKVPGRELDGIHFAMDFLVQQNNRVAGEPLQGPEILAGGKNVVVIGGGDTGADCVGTSNRQGAKSVRQFEILDDPPPERAQSTPWPLWPLMRRDSSSHQEGAERRWAVSTTEFLGDENKTVRALKCVEVEWQGSKAGVGPPRPVEKPGTEFTVDAQLVLLAMGFVGPGRNLLVDEQGLERDARGFIRCDEHHMTSEPGVFVAGDMTQGASLVVRAIQDGKVAARDIIAYCGVG